MTDRREKLIAYRKLPSMVSYLIVEQEMKVVERHYQDQGGRWLSELIDEGGIFVPCPPSFELFLADIYEGV